MAHHPILLLAPEGAEQIGDVGKACLWIAFVGLFLPAVYMFKSAFDQPDGKRYFHILSALICAIASLAYLCMASGYGDLFVFGHDGVYRQFFFIRYIDWVFTTPLMLLDLAGLAGASSDTTFMMISLDVLMILSGLAGALIGGSDTTSWACWGFGMLCFLPIVKFLLVDLPGNASGSASAIFKKVSMLTVVFWSLYPLVWILAEGTSVISSDIETVLYTILDVTAKSVFGLLIVGARDGLDDALARPLVPRT